MADLDGELSYESSLAQFSRADIVLVVCLLMASLAIYVKEIYACFGPGAPLCFGDSNSPADFAYLWTISNLQGSGDLSQLFDREHVLQLQIALTGSTEEYVWAYPPQSLFLLWPLSLAPLVPAYVAWVGLGLVLLLWSCLSFTRFRLFCALTVLLSPAIFVNAFAGHNGFFTATLLIGGILLASRRPIVAGILFGLLTFKPQLGLLVPVALIAARLWRPFISATVTSIGLVLASIAIHGTELWTTFLLNASGSGVSIVRNAAGPFTELMPTVFMAGRILELPEHLIIVAQGVTSAAAIIATYAVVRRNRDPIVWAAVISLGTFLVSPTAFVYDMVVMAVATILLTVNSRPEDLLPFERVILILLWMLPVLTIYLNKAAIPLAPLVLIVGFIYVVFKGLRGHRTSMTWTESQVSIHNGVLGRSA